MRPGFAAAIALEVPKEPFHDIVGSLGLDGSGALQGGHHQRGGKELGARVFNLLDHFLEGGRGGIIGTSTDLCRKLLDLLLEGVHLDGLALLIKSLAPAHRGDAQGLAQLLEEWDRGLKLLEGASQGAIRCQGSEIQVQVVKGQMVPPKLARRQSFEGLEVRVNFLRALGQRQQRAIKGEAVAPALLQARQNPVGQEISRQQWGLRQRRSGQATGRQLVERLPQLRTGVDLLLPTPQPSAQMAGGAVGLESLAHGVIFGPQEVLAQITQEMEVTDIVGQAGEHLLDGAQNAFGQLMHQGQGRAETLVELAQEGDDPVRFFAGQFDVAQDDFHDRIDAGHQQGTFIFIGGIQVQDVASLQDHRLFESGGALSMRQGQKGDEAAAQLGHGAGA
ncbi:MAG: hypothetical protein AAB676_16615 [Verrucomicrobiota bacterium]